MEFTQLIRFTAKKNGDVDSEEDEGLIEWDWIGEDSPMMSKGSEAEFVLDRLCESMQRYIKLAPTPAQDGSEEAKEPPQPHRGHYIGSNEKDQRDMPGWSSGGSEDDIGPLDKRADTRDTTGR